MTFPATDYRSATDLAIDASNQLHRIINEDATSTITTESGPVGSIRKALVDNFYFKQPVDWVEGQTESVFNQLRLFTNGFTYYAPSAKSTAPVSMGTTPVGDSAWVLVQFAEAPTIANAVLVCTTKAAEAEAAAGSAIQPVGSTIISYADGTHVASSPNMSRLNGKIQSYTLSSPETFTFDLTEGQSLRLHVINGDINTPTFPVVRWENVTPPTLSTETVIDFWIFNSELFGKVIGNY